MAIVKNSSKVKKLDLTGDVGIGETTDRVLQVPMALNALEINIKNLTTLLDTLEKRIASVCYTNVAKSIEDDKKQSQEVCSLSQSILDNNYKIEQQNLRIQYFLNNLQI